MLRPFHFAVQQLRIFWYNWESLRRSVPVSIAKNVEFLQRLSKINGINGLGDFGWPNQSQSPLVEVTGFSGNPGPLDMFAFVPNELQPKPPLVVVLFGCGQTGSGYDLGRRWSSLPACYGFALLMPEQQGANNPNGF